MKKIIALSVVLLIHLFALSASAQYELDSVTITATLQPVSATATGRNILIIRGEQFSKLPINSIDELLRYLPGIEVQMRGPMGAQSDIVMRGGTFQQVLVILDGIRINDPNTGHFNSYIPIAPSEILRIEVLKGASSAIYGSEAVGGVIHIITKSFAAKKGQEGKQFLAQTSLGEYGLRNVHAGGTYTRANTSISAGILSNNATGQPQRGINGFFYNTTTSVSVKQYVNEQWSVSFRGAYDKRNFAAQNFYTTFLSDTAKEKVTSYWNHIRVAFAREKQSFSLDAGYKSVTDNYRFNPVSTPNENRSRLLQTLAVYNFKASDNTSLSVGGQLVNRKIVSNDRGNHQLNQAAAFAVINQSFGNNLYVSPALRVDWNERTGWEVVPQINTSYKLNALVVRASAGKTTREADFTERFNNYNKSFVAGGSIGNPELQPERSFSYEAGVDFLGIKHMKVAATFFERRHKQLIDYVPTPFAEMPRQSNLSPTGKYALAKNIGNVKTRGLEIDVQYTRRLHDHQSLWAALGLNLLTSKSNNGTPSFYLSSHAKSLVNAAVQYTVSWLTISASSIYKERQVQSVPTINASITKNYFLLNLKTQAMVLENKLGVFVQMDNVFNKSYSDILGSQMPGRWLMGGLKLTL
jgi:iron complex outermembrane receptor protein